jgi:poly(3-hydroxybutyrate) depolymerase
MGENNSRGTSITRREFTQAVGGTGLLAAATDPTAAEAVRGEPLATTAETAVSEPFTPSDWHAVGPFHYQRRGVETGWLFPHGGESAFGSATTRPDEGQRFQSALAGGATVEWDTRSASGSSVSLDFSDRIDPTGGDLTPLFGGRGLFDDFQDWFGLGGVLYATGYAVTTFELDAPRRAVLETDASKLWLNGHQYEDPRSGVVLQEGTNVVLAKQTLILGSGAVSVSFRPPRAPVEVDELAAFRGTPQNAILPDLREGERTDRPASVRVTNTTGEAVEGTLSFAPDSDLLVEQTVEIDPPLAPFETRRIETRVRTKGPVSPNAKSADVQAAGSESVPSVSMAATSTGEALGESREAKAAGSASFSVEATDASVRTEVTAGGESDARQIPLRIRGRDEPKYQTTFVSEHDGSVQEFSVREPTDADSAGSFGLVLSLHGANVPSINQAGGAYGRKEGVYVVAPGARGPVNYDHEDLGRLDDLEAMEVAKERFDVDESRVYLTGHSMGGHGTWHVGLTHSDRFAAIAPSAGWTDHETYITTTFGRDKLHTYPGLKAVKETALQKNLALPKTENAVDGTLPVFALHGGQDAAVPTNHPRSFMRALANRGLDVQGEVGRRYSTPDPEAVDGAFLEVPGKGHWWDDGIGAGTDCVNHPDLMAFLAETERDPYPAAVRFFTTNLRVEHEKYWVAVREQEQVHAPTRVDAEVTGDGIELSTENVSVLELDLAVLREHGGAARLHVGGESLRLPGRGGTAYVSLSGSPSVSRSPPESGTGSGSDLRKTPDQYGPLKEVHHDPYLLVYGTQGNDQETAAARNLANLRSVRLVERARAPATVVADTAVGREEVEKYNLVLYGRPETNAIFGHIADDLPVQIGDGYASVGGETYEGDLGVEFVYPNPEAPDNLVQVETGTSLAGLRLTGARNWIPTQKATADYAIFDESIRFQSWNACRAAGFFDGEWSVDESLGHLRKTR